MNNPNIADRWLNAPYSKLDETARQNLYRDTENFVDYLGKQVVLDPDNTLKICHAISDQFAHARYELKENLPLWIAEHSELITHLTEEQSKGAYVPFHHLLQKISEITQKTIDPGNIDAQSLTNMRFKSHGMTKDLMGQINFYKRAIDDTGIQKLIALCGQNESREVALNLLIDRLNKGDFYLDEIECKTVGDIIKFFGKDCSKITRLDLESFPVNDRDLEEIAKHFTNLDTLILKGIIAEKEFTDLGTIYFTNMPKLTNLNLGQCKYIQDFSFLKKCPKLTSLGFSGPLQTADLSFLKKAPQLKNLDLSWCNQIKDFNFLEDLPHLLSLDLTGCNQIVDLSFLENCLQLESLNLGQCDNIEDINLLSNFTQLKHLTLDLFGQQDMDVLNSLKQLTSLRVSGLGEIEDVSVLNNLTQLKSLEILNGNSIEDLSFLENLSQLTNLNLSGFHQITDLNFLEKCPQLTNLKLNGFHQITDTSPLKNCLFLKDLTLTYCTHISDVSVLEKCPQLVKVDLSMCFDLKDLTVLEKCLNLKKIHLGFLKNIDEPSLEVLRGLSYKGVDVYPFELVNK